jgi:hypothetical protein
MRLDPSGSPRVSVALSALFVSCERGIERDTMKRALALRPLTVEEVRQLRLGCRAAKGMTVRTSCASAWATERQTSRLKNRRASRPTGNKRQ